MSLSKSFNYLRCVGNLHASFIHSRIPIEHKINQGYQEGAWEVDHQWIINGALQCSQHLNNKKMGCQSVSFWSKLKRNIDQISKNIRKHLFW